jgi:hypothetical protein
MRSNLLASFALLAVVSVFTACGDSSRSAATDEIKIDEGFKGNELVITDSDFDNKSIQIEHDGRTAIEPKRVLNDKSEVESMVDGFGNRTEKRTFMGHPRLRYVLVRTKIDGSRTVTVYGFGSDTTSLDEIGERALTASPDEIANAAKLYATRGFGSTPPDFMKKGKNSLQPMPSSQFPVRAPQSAERIPESSDTQSPPTTQSVRNPAEETPKIRE